MPYRANYPATAAECIDDTLKYRRGVIPAVKALAASKPFRGTMQERIAKLKACAVALSEVYGIAPPLLIVSNTRHDCYHPGSKTISLDQRGERGPSVITFLHEYLGKDERQAVRWSLTLFKRCFPRSFSRLSQDRHCMR